MMVKSLAKALLLFAGITGGEAWAQDARAGQQKARACSACHGPLGIATAPDAPHLAGGSHIYMERQLEAYRSGERVHQQMTLIAKGLSDEDIADLSAWFSKIKITAEAPDLED